MIFVTIGTQHHNNTAILRLCARIMRGQAHAQTFNIAYSMLHKISFRMSGRSSLCDVWFSQTLRHKFDLYIYLSIYLSIIPKTKKFGCVGRGDLTFLFKSCEIYESQGRLI